MDRYELYLAIQTEIYQGQVMRIEDHITSMLEAAPVTTSKFSGIDEWRTWLEVLVKKMEAIRKLNEWTENVKRDMSLPEEGRSDDRDCFFEDRIIDELRRLDAALKGPDEEEVAHLERELRILSDFGREHVVFSEEYVYPVQGMESKPVRYVPPECRSNHNELVKKYIEKED